MQLSSATKQEEEADCPFLPNCRTDGLSLSSSPTTDADDKQIEFGITPNIQIDMTDDDMSKGLDTIIEKARQVINSKS